MLLYGSLQIMVLYQYGDTTVSMSYKDSYYSMDIQFPREIDDLHYENFQIAFGLITPGANQTVDDPRYGRIFARTDQWGFDEERNTEIAIHKCSDEELGLGK